MTRLRNISLALRLQGMVALLILGFLIAIVDMLHIERDRALDARATELRTLVQVARGIANSLHAEEIAGKLTHAVALEDFRQSVHAMRYGGDDYIFAY
ncbi:MAG TPA: hypothetical protein VHX39_03400, partial [Acetobacteraceae bacterium]|nr:hypothetical protein [Acetobacteraceae bacterium]